MITIRKSSPFAVVVFVLSALVGVSPPNADGRFVRVDVVNVPVERLASNLEKAIEKEPKNAQAVLNLARLHAMAYSLRTGAALDDNGDGRLTGNELAGLALWHDANGNGISDPGEVKSLAEHRIVALSCGADRDAKHPDRIAFSRNGVTFSNGCSRSTFDLVLHLAK